MQDSTIIATSALDGVSFTTQVNAAFATLASAHYGPTDPATQPLVFTVGPGCLWWDTTPTPDELKVRNAANDGWVTLLKLDGAAGPALQAALDARLALAGGTMTGALTLSGAPSSGLHAATKTYVDATSRPAPLRYLVQGDASVTTKYAQILVEQSCQLTRIDMWADTAPAGASLSVTLVRRRAAAADDTRTAAITAGNNSVSTVLGTALALLQGDRVRLDISGVGSSTAGGNDLLVTGVLAPP